MNVCVYCGKKDGQHDCLCPMVQTSTVAATPATSISMDDLVRARQAILKPPDRTIVITRIVSTMMIVPLPGHEYILIPRGDWGRLLYYLRHSPDLYDPRQAQDYSTLYGIPIVEDDALAAKVIGEAIRDNVAP